MESGLPGLSGRCRTSWRWFGRPVGKAKENRPQQLMGQLRAEAVRKMNVWWWIGGRLGLGANQCRCTRAEIAADAVGMRSASRDDDCVEDTKRSEAMDK